MDLLSWEMCNVLFLFYPCEVLLILNSQEVLTFYKGSITGSYRIESGFRVQGMKVYSSTENFEKLGLLSMDFGSQSQCWFLPILLFLPGSVERKCRKESRYLASNSLAMLDV